jgi:hypothetical protein
MPHHASSTLYYELNPPPPPPPALPLQVLIKVHSVVIPNVADPLLLADFLTHSIDQGGLLGVLALNGLFLLVTQHGLEYPRFYQRLYSLLQVSGGGALWVDYGALRVDCGALWVDYGALRVDCGALWVDYGALWVDCASACAACSR